MSLTVNVTGITGKDVVSISALNEIVPWSLPSQFETTRIISFVPTTNKLEAFKLVILSKDWKPNPPLIFEPFEFRTTLWKIESLKLSTVILPSNATWIPLIYIWTPLSTEAKSVALIALKDARLNVFR